MQNNFYLPFMGQDTINLAFIMQECLDKYSSYVKYPNPIIAGLYGSFNNIIWNGGRTIITSDFQNFEEVKQCLNNINKHNLKCKFTFTNQLLTKEHCENQYCNQILKLIADTNNEITIHSKLLENYISSLYPEIPLTSSITKGFDFETFKIALNQNYKNVVCYYKQNILKYLETVPFNLQQKTELILNADDCAYCKMCKKHYECESFYNLHNYYLHENGCYRFHPMYDAKKEWFSLPIEERLYFDINYFQWLNINTYKIQGRMKTIEQLLETYLYIFFYPSMYQEIYDYLKDNINN